MIWVHHSRARAGPRPSLPGARGGIPARGAVADRDLAHGVVAHAAVVAGARRSHAAARASRDRRAARAVPLDRPIAAVRAASGVSNRLPTRHLHDVDACSVGPWLQSLARGRREREPGHSGPGALAFSACSSGIKPDEGKKGLSIAGAPEACKAGGHQYPWAAARHQHPRSNMSRKFRILRRPRHAGALLRGLFLRDLPVQPGGGLVQARRPALVPRDVDFFYSFDLSLFDRFPHLR